METSEVNVSELAAALRREKLLISSERAQLQQLNESVATRALEVLQVGWLCSQQRYNLTALVAARCEEDSVQACRRASLLDSTVFLDAYKVLRYKDALALGELLGWLRESPHLVSLCLALGEEALPASLPPSLAAGLYGGGRLPHERTRLLAVLRSLIKHQLAPLSDPRKLFRTGKCALARLFAVFCESHLPARQFLVACLHAPVMALLQEDDFFLDVDPDKGLERFPAADRLKKFGQPNSPEYNAKVARYRKWTVQSLANLTSRFVASLRDHWSSFPSNIAWIVQQVAHVLKQHSRISERELHALCTDLVLTHFVCPAVVNPEAHGIVDVPVSFVARFNLIQVAQILQMLSLSRHQEVEWKVRDLYARFERECVWSLVEELVSQPAHCPDGACAAAPEALHASLRTEPAPHTAVALFTRQQLHTLITYLKRISSKLNNNTPSMTSEEYSSGSTPRAAGSPYEGGGALGAAGRSEAGSTSASEAGSSVEDGYTAPLAALLHTLEPNYRSRLHDLLRKQPDFTAATAPTALEKEPQPEGSHNGKKSLLAKVSKPRLPRSASSASSLGGGGGGGSGVVPATRAAAGAGELEAGDAATEQPEVLIIKLTNVDEQDFVGMVPEAKVLECYYGGADPADSEEPGPEPCSQPAVQKRTRFSVSHDEVSLGNTSDNLEAVSEAASNHSVTSSLELETEDQNDNLSDMVSANVSGRGSPNISGRETPSSQVTDGDGGAPGDILPVRRIPLSAPAQQAAHVAQAKLLKETRNEIEDKFCKFEIRKLLEGDETISIISDTWSTDVLASDSETIGDSCDHAHSAQPPVAAHGTALGASAVVPDVSETASESAWSMDVLASDSDRNTEVDTDDCASVAARSDTSWPRRPSQLDDAPALVPGAASAPSRPHAQQNGNALRNELMSPRHAARPGHHQSRAGGYLSATAQLSRGAELDLSSSAVPPGAFSSPIDNRKSILVNGYPVMTCYTNSAPESPGAAPSVLSPQRHAFNCTPSSGRDDAATESTLEAAAAAGAAEAAAEGEGEAADDAGDSSDATSQWVDDSFPAAATARGAGGAARGADGGADGGYLPPAADLLPRSLNSSESSFNASSSSHFDRSRFEGAGGGDEAREPRAEPADSRSSITDLMTRMSSATISSSANLVSNIAARIVKSEMRTSIVSISSTRVERARAAGGSDVSLSTLSVTSEGTSASDRSSSQDVNSDNVTERRVTPPPPPPPLSTGAIPKSISFDATAEKAQRCRRAGVGACEEAAGAAATVAGAGAGATGLDELRNNMKRSGSNLLNKMKIFRHKGRPAAAPLHSTDIKFTEGELRSEEGISKENNESSEDILAKYRRKSSSESSRARRTSRRPSDPAPPPDVELDREGATDLSNPDVFESVKRRLRLLLSSPDLLCADYVPSRGTSASLVEWVRAASGAARAAGGEMAAALASEAARALASAGPPAAAGPAAARLACALRADLAARRPYAAYLAHCRSGLTHTLLLLDRQLVALRWECEASARGAGAVRALEQLERGNALRRLVRHHHAHTHHAMQLNGGELMDEKAARLTANIKAITAEVKANPCWEDASPAVLEAAELAVERAAFARLYLHVMFPNGDGDLARDQVLSDHIRRLAASVSAAAAGVAPRHLWAAPWPRAQQHLSHLAVYRAPRDKVACVMRCVTSIMAVLGLTEEGAAPAADDLTPVLVYVVIRVNPPSLLSTIQFVNALGGAALSGEALYWWTHFCAAVTYIKTMDYPRAASSRHSST